MAVVVGLTLVTSVYAQKWDTILQVQDLSKGKPFKFTGEIQSIDPKAQTAVVKVGDKTYTGRFGYAKYEGAYEGVKDLKLGEKVTGEGVQLEGDNWVTKIAPAPAGAAPMAGPKKD